MRLIGPPSATRSVVAANLAAQPGIHPRFVREMFPALWDAAVVNEVDPVGVVAQAFKETGGGNFTGRVRPEHYNTAGIKVRHLGYGGPATMGDEQLAHAAFASWQVGALAHVQHLLAYAGVPVGTLIVDPRYWLVAGKHRLEDFEDLGGRWAPSASYGTEIVAIARRLQTPLA